MGKALNVGKIAKKPAGEIDDGRPLVNELAATRAFGVGPPFLLISDATAMAVARSDEHELVEAAVIHERARLARGTRIGVIKPDANSDPLGSRQRDERLDLRHETTRRLFNEDMFARR